VAFVAGVGVSFGVGVAFPGVVLEDVDDAFMLAGVFPAIGLSTFELVVFEPVTTDEFSD
jgi:hypothetical protein